LDESGEVIAQVGIISANGDQAIGNIPRSGAYSAAAA